MSLPLILMMYSLSTIIHQTIVIVSWSLLFLLFAQYFYPKYTTCCFIPRSLRMQ
uniref:Uncharacterized protein n=1 Tax=Arundo donax TaxID=35708 RepID=A0A0A9AHQ0_ARUDO